MTWDITVLVISCMSVYFMLGNESNMVVLTVFVIAYATLRNKAGGVHATNRKSCILLTATLFIVSMYYSMHNTLSGYINFISTIAFAMILRTGPIEQIQKRLSLLQIKKSTRLLKRLVKQFKWLLYLLRSFNKYKKVSVVFNIQKREIENTTDTFIVI